MTEKVKTEHDETVSVNKLTYANANVFNVNVRSGQTSEYHGIRDRNWPIPTTGFEIERRDGTGPEKWWKMAVEGRRKYLDENFNLSI